MEINSHWVGFNDDSLSFLPGLQSKGEKSLTSKYGLVPESPDFLHCEKPTFTDFITSLIFKIS